ncbi:MAG TPA: hypothetical protein VMJ10_17250 [Kofleriaceae bacterium]|nr:hypothetical protein [Kofleriaceae bacterium]
MRDELERFVTSLAIPDDRKAVVLAELTDHVSCAVEQAVREGRDRDAAARAALGDLEALRRSLEAIEPAFRISKPRAVARGVLASLVVAIAIAEGGSIMHGVIGAMFAIAVVVALAPARVLDLLRAELRAPRVRGTFIRGVRIGPALAYAFTVLAVPHVVWIALIVAHAFRGITEFDTPLSAFAIMTAVSAAIFVEMFRARRRSVA